MYRDPYMMYVLPVTQSCTLNLTIIKIMKYLYRTRCDSNAAVDCGLWIVVYIYIYICMRGTIETSA